MSQPGDGQHVAPLEVVLRQADEVGGHPRARRYRVQLPLVALEAAYPRRKALRQHLDLLTDAQCPVDQRASDDGAETRHRERAVERETWPSEVLPGTGVLQKGLYGRR